MDVITYALAKKMGGGGGESITYTLTADTENKTIVLTPSRGTAQVITVPYATDASTVNGHEVPELENGKIPANYLPSFVDNVDEYDNISLFPVVGESNRIYIDKSTNKTYRWSGTAYVEISESIALGETSSTAYRGDRGKIAYDHSQSAHAPSNAEANQNAFSNVKIDSDIINASAKTDTLEFIAGDNIILTPNVSNKKITVSQVPVRATASGDIASFSDGTGDPFLEVKVNIEPVQSGSGDPSPSNVRPISGWSGANVTRCGKNRITSITEGIELNSADGTIKSNASWYVADYSRVEYGKTYYVSGTSSSTVCYYDEYKNFTRNTLSQQTITPQEGECYVRVNSLISGYAEPQIEEGNEATSFSPFGQTYTIQFKDGDNPLTVYGGTFDVVSGVLAVDRVGIKGVNVEKVGQTSSGVPYVDTTNIYADLVENTTTISDRYVQINTSQSGESGNFRVYDGEFTIYDGRFTDITTAQSLLNDVEFVYELATPQTYQLTPAQVSTLLGQNNIFADCGQIEVAYKTPFYTDLTTKNEVQVLINKSITSALNASY